jgi:signal transduction histidine kinase
MTVADDLVVRRPEALLERLLDATRRLAAAPPEASLVQTIADTALMVFGGPGTALFLVEGDTAVLAAASGCCTALPPGLPVTRTPPALWSAMMMGAITAVTHETPEGLTDQQPALAVPLAGRKDLVGFLWLRSNRPGEPYDDELLALTILATQATAALENAYQIREFLEAVRKKERETATLAHELRTPLGAIINTLRVLERHGASDVQVVRLRELIGRQARHLTRLIEDVLDVARLYHGKLRLQRRPVELCEVVRQALDTLRATGRADEHDLRQRLTDAPVLVDGDAVRLEQIVRNLLDNAVKYSPAPAQIDVSVDRTETEAILGVRDEGIGIGPAMLSRLFEPFAQAERATTRSAGGLGLGLPLVRALVEQHGGTITAHSDGLGRGSHFIVRLPVRSPAP